LIQFDIDIDRDKERHLLISRADQNVITFKYISTHCLGYYTRTVLSVTCNTTHALDAFRITDEIAVAHRSRRRRHRSKSQTLRSLTNKYLVS